MAAHHEWLVPYSGLAVAAYGATLVMTAQGFNRVLTGLVGYGSLGLSLIYALYYYLPLDIDTFASMPVLKSIAKGPFALGNITLLFGGLSLIFMFLYIGMQYRKKHALNPLYTLMHPFIGAALGVLIFLLIRAYSIYGILYYYLAFEARSKVASFMQFLSSGYSDIPVVNIPVREGFHHAKEYILTVYYALTGLLLIGSGLVYKKPYMRFVGLALLLLTVLSTLFSVWLRSKEFTGIITMVFGGVLVLGASFLYQRLLKK